MSSLVTARIEQEDATSGFSCGIHALDDYLRRHALPNDQRGLGRTFVLRRKADEADHPAVLGFYTLSMATLESSLAPPPEAGRLPRYPLPVALIGRLATDQRVRGRGLGAMLLADALERIWGLSAEIGCYGVIVDAKSEDAERFYSRFNFTSLTETLPRRMFLPMSVVEQLVRLD